MRYQLALVLNFGKCLLIYGVCCNKVMIKDLVYINLSHHYLVKCAAPSLLTFYWWLVFKGSDSELDINS